MQNSNTLKEAARLHKLGFAVHWLHPKSKRPIESGWTTGPRKPWDYLEETYIEGLNVGVRLGTPSKLGAGYLCVVDVDVKSKEEHHKAAAVRAAKSLLGTSLCPMVKSGRGNGSRHYYCLTAEPFKTFNPAQSTDMIKVHMPSKKPSKKEIEALTPKEINEGIRISHAWEISLYSDGRQVVLPPSVHPDSGELYTWYRHLSTINDLPLIEFKIPQGEQNENSKSNKSHNTSAHERGDGHNFEIEPVELGWLPISDRIKSAIIDGKDVDDRSGFLLAASSALLSGGLNTNEVLTVLTDPNTFLGACAYDHAKTKDRKRAANWVYKYTLAKVKAERSAKGVFTPATEMPESSLLTEAERNEQDSAIAEERPWQQDLIRSGTKGDGPPKSCVINVVLILENAVSPALFERNVFAYRDTYGEDAPWGGVKSDVLIDDDVAKIKYWLSQNYGFEPKNQVIEDAVLIMACKNSFDPVKNAIEALPEWDGVARLDTWLVKNFNAKGSAAYNGEIFRKWLVAMIMRIYKPGAKFDWMPIFEGPQRAGKSSFGKLLAGGEKYFLDWLPNLNDKDAALALQGMWVIEMGELASLRKNEIEVVKGFVTRTVDKLRPPFGRRSIESARRCVFFGTTNREQYLQDDTGNRRFKPIIVGALNFKALKADRVQLFAEAKHLWINKIETERTLDRLSPEAAQYEISVHSDKMIEDESSLMFEAISDFISGLENDSDFDVERFRIYDLFQAQNGGGLPPLNKWRLDRRNTMLAAKALKMMGGSKRPSNKKNYWKLPKSLILGKIAQPFKRGCTVDFSEGERAN